VIVAVAGKGGAGKTTVSAALARLCGRAGGVVLAVDADPNPNLAPALGLSGRPEPLPATVVSHRFGGHALLRPLAEVLATYGMRGPDGVTLVSTQPPTGPGTGCLCGAQAAVAALLADLRADPGAPHTVVDLEASPEHFSRGTAAAVDVLGLVAEPYYRSLESVARLADLAGQAGLVTVLIANKLRDRPDQDAVRAFAQRRGLRLIGEVPWSEEVTTADRSGQALVDASPRGAVVTAVEQLGRDLGVLPPTPGS